MFTNMATMIHSLCSEKNTIFTVHILIINKQKQFSFLYRTEESTNCKLFAANKFVLFWNFTINIFWLESRNFSRQKSQNHVSGLQVRILIWNSTIACPRHCRPVAVVAVAGAVIEVGRLDGWWARHLAGGGQRLLLVNGSGLCVRC